MPIDRRNIATAWTRARRLGWLLWVAALAGLAVFVAPEIAVRLARRKATACLAQAREARGPELPDCTKIVRDFDYPTEYSYTRHDATYRAEELLARVAMNRYVDAAVGNPDPVRLDAGATAVRGAQDLLEKGSRRISFEELGPSIGAPHLGKMASGLGDRATLLSSPEFFGLWHIRRDVMEAAFVEADFEEVDSIAERYVEWSPVDADLVTTIGAALCITNPPEGYELLEKVPARRAEKRYENMQRNYGEVFAALTACSAKAGASPPVLPDDSGAGVPDMAASRRLVELRVASAGDDRQAALRRSIQMLGGTSLDPIDRDQPYARAMLLAAVVALSTEPLDAATLADLAARRADEGEGPFAPRAASLRSLLVRGPGLYPIVPGDWLRHAARTVAETSRTARGSEATTLEGAAGGLFTLAAIELASDGRVEDAVEAALDGARWSNEPPAIGALSAASAAYVAGAPARALAIIDEASKAARTDDERDVAVALAVVEALAAASTGDRARADAVATELLAAAAEVEDADLASLARWIVVAFKPELVAAESDDAGSIVLKWSGQAEPLGRYRDRARVALEEKQTLFSHTIRGPGPKRRAFRYRLLDHRGDMPLLALPMLVASAQLLDEGTSSEGVEIWLDALTALDLRRMRLRSYAWMRMEAARIRGDAGAAELWADRLSILRQIASHEDDLELSRFLRF